MSESAVEVKGIDKSPFLVEYEKLSGDLRPTYFKPELVKPLDVTNIESTPVADSLYEKDSKGNPIVDTLLVGTDPSATHYAAMKGGKYESKYSSTVTDGRVIRLDFGGDVVEIPSLHNEASSNRNIVLAVKDEGIKIPIEGIAIKGGGKPYHYNPETRYGIRNHPSAGGVSTEFTRYGGRIHKADVVGGANSEHQHYERDLLIDYLGMGARVDVPILTADVNVLQDYRLGLLALGYRTPFNFEHFAQTKKFEPNKHKFLMMHGISIWRREGLIDNNELDAIFANQPISYGQQIEQSRQLLHFYVKNGARIAGGDLAIIHKKGSIGNRNPQNMGNDFGHRDVGDAKEANIVTMAVDRALKGEDVLDKFKDIYNELDIIKTFVSRENPEVGSKFYFPEAVYEYLKAYFQKPGGMTEREFGVCLLGKVVNIVDIDRDPVVLKALTQAYRKVVLENKANKNPVLQG